jgi:hypothetical protein
LQQTNSSVSDMVDFQDLITFFLDKQLAVRLYNDSRPTCLETAPLQKGLVLMLNDKELIEEGVGFGVPVVKYQDKTYFSSSSEVIKKTSGYEFELKKTFKLDTVSCKSWNGKRVNDDLYTLFRELFEKIYLKNKNLSLACNKLMELREIAQIKTEFVKVKNRGLINVNYSFNQSSIKIDIDFSELISDECEEIMILNEQGSSTFRKYADSNGLLLIDRQIGAWDLVTANEASLQNMNANLTFTLRNSDKAKLFRGWEKTRNRFSWAGLSYSLPPKTKSFNYLIKLSLN